MKNGEMIWANIYVDWDGDSAGESLRFFFKELKKNVSDNRFKDAEYLAARFLVWNTGDPESPKHYLDFLGIAPCIEDHGDIEYIYEVNCNAHDSDGFPIVTKIEIKE